MVVFAWVFHLKKKSKERGEPHPPLMITVISTRIGTFFYMYESRATRCAVPLLMNRFAYRYLLHHVPTICTCLFFVKTYAYCMHIFAHHCLTHASLYTDKLGCFNNAYIVRT